MSGKVILAVDMLKGFLEKEYPMFCGETARRIIPNVVSLIKDSEENDIIYICDSHEKNDHEFKMPKNIIVAGVCTDICILYTVANLRNRDYTVEVMADCVASFNEEGHRFALKHMKKILGAKIV